MVTAGLMLAGLLQFGQGAYIHAKAVLAQALLERAWDRTLHREAESRPWAWADTWPVARLRVPALGIDRIVLAGDSGNVLAFGPGWIPGSAPAGSRGRVVISGHRDTHFRFLDDIGSGEVLLLQFSDGSERRYRVVGARIADTRAQNGGSLYPPADGLTLITCYPFDAVRPGGTLRYLVDADPV
ncbi:MAG TPA: class GN sortase [Gammaproteobacteria bacterium]|nr:class GN sortase [Gammaproteobacteria bacterium]